MSENEWLTSTDPSAMYTFIKDRVTERQQRFFVEACRRLCVEWQYVGEDHYSAAFSAWCTGSAYRSPVLEVRADLLREIVGNPFKKHYRDKEGLWIDQGMGKHGAHRWADCTEWLTWSHAAVPNLIREMTEEECGKCDGGGLRYGQVGYDSYGPRKCKACNGKGYVPRAEPQWETMLLIADALEEAGCAEAAILRHLRGQCPEGPENHDGGWFEGASRVMCPLFEQYHGSHKRPVRHVRGCWVIELLTGAAQ